MKYLNMLSTPTKEKFDKTIEQILNSPKYKHFNESYIDIMEKFKQRIISWLESWLKSLDINSEKISRAVPSASNGVMIVGTIIIILIIILMFLSIRKMIKKDKKVKRILGEIIDEKTTTEGLYAKAKKFKELNQYRDALRYSFIALLFLMNENNLLRLDETQTNSEIVYELRKNKFKNIDLFEDTANLFNKVWYGHKIIDEKAYESWEKTIEALNDGVNDIAKQK